MKRKPRDINQTVGVVEIDAATIARLRRKALRAHQEWSRGEPYRAVAEDGIALARDVLKVFAGKGGAKEPK